MRQVWGWLVATVATTGIFLASLVALPFSRRGRVHADLMQTWGRMVAWGMGVRIETQGLEDLPDGPCVLVANHASMLDIVVCAAVLPIPFHFVSRPFFFKVPILGWAMYLGRHVSLDPSDPRAAARVLKSLGPRFERGLSVALFPEGTRSPDGRVGRYRRGPFLTAIRHGVPVVPIRLTGTHERLPRGSLRFRPGPVRVTIGAPIPTEGLGKSQAGELAARIEEWTRAG